MVCYSGLMKKNSYDSHATKINCTFVKCKLWSVVATQFTMNVLKEGFFVFVFLQLVEYFNFWLLIHGTVNY